MNISEPEANEPRWRSLPPCGSYWARSLVSPSLNARSSLTSHRRRCQHDGGTCQPQRYLPRLRCNSLSVWTF